MKAASLRGPSLALGIAAGGFFDGILLHQILQWHHLLSAVNDVDTLRFQLVADGLFHALMYVIAVVALALLWRRRAALADSASGRFVGGHALIGFGTWHVLDAVLSHWLLGIHRIRMDVPDPLIWDLIWLAGFGLLPILAGWFVLRSRIRGGGGDHGRTVAASLAVFALLGGLVAAVPFRNDAPVVVLFPASVSPAQAFNALARMDARLVWVDPSGGLWAVQMADRAAAWRFYLDGALLVSNAGASMGCMAWTRPP